MYVVSAGSSNTLPTGLIYTPSSISSRSASLSTQYPSHSFDSSMPSKSSTIKSPRVRSEVAHTSRNSGHPEAKDKPDIEIGEATAAPPHAQHTRTRTKHKTRKLSLAEFWNHENCFDVKSCKCCRTDVDEHFKFSIEDLSSILPDHVQHSKMSRHKVRVGIEDDCCVKSHDSSVGTVDQDHGDSLAIASASISHSSIASDSDSRKEPGGG